MDLEQAKAEVEKAEKDGFFQKLGKGSVNLIKDIGRAMRNGFVAMFELAFAMFGAGVGQMLGILLAIILVAGAGALFA